MTSLERPFCYTQDPFVRWEYCDCEPCNRTRTGIQCQRWDATYPHKPNWLPVGNMTLPQYRIDLSSKHNYCDNPNGEDDGKWCYTTDPNVRWDYCDPNCRNQKEVTQITTCPYTASGRHCQRWDSYEPHKPNYKPYIR